MTTENSFTEEQEFNGQDLGDSYISSAIDEGEDEVQAEGGEEGDFEDEDDEDEDEIAPFENSVFDAPEDPLAS